MQGGFAPRPRTAPDPSIVQTPRVSTGGMRRLGVRQKETEGPTVSGGSAGMSGGVGPTNAAAGGSCAYQVGDRVSHPTFGEGVVRRIEMLVSDHKLVVDFGRAGEKTLLARFAKLTKL